MARLTARAGPGACRFASRAAMQARASPPAAAAPALRCAAHRNVVSRASAPHSAASSAPGLTPPARAPGAACAVPRREARRWWPSPAVATERADAGAGASAAADAPPPSPHRAVLVRQARSSGELEAAAALRAEAFYEDLAERQALPFPRRFLPTFVAEFAERELRSLEQRTRGRVGASLACACLVAVPAAGDDDADGALHAESAALLGCLDVSWKTGPCGSSINGQCVAEGEQFCYIDNVCVAAAARRAGVASAMLAAASAVAGAYGSDCVLTHVHVANEGARTLYAQWGFSAPPLDGSRQESFARASDRMRGLLLLRAPLPLLRTPPRARRRGLVQQQADAVAPQCSCGGAEWGLVCVCPDRIA